MNRRDFLLAMDSMLDLPAGTLQGPESLADLDEWNSLAMVEYIALADSNSATVQPRQIRECETVDDLRRLARVD